MLRRESSLSSLISLILSTKIFAFFGSICLVIKAIAIDEKEESLSRVVRMDRSFLLKKKTIIICKNNTVKIKMSQVKKVYNFCYSIFRSPICHSRDLSRDKINILFFGKAGIQNNFNRLDFRRSLSST